MGSSYHVYVGPYIHIVQVEKEVEHTFLGCPTKGCAKYGKELDTPCCPQCGARVASIKTTRKTYVSAREYLEELGDVDMFQVVDISSSKEIQVCIPNMDEQGGLRLERGDGAEWRIPPEDFSHPDWKKLSDYLDAKKIPYEKRHGIIEWWW